MAKLKIKGQNEFIFVPDYEARIVRDRMVKKEIGNDQFVQMGRFSGQVKNIAAIIFEREEEDPFAQNKTPFDVYKDERKKLAMLTDEEMLERQKKYYEFCAKIFRVDNDFPALEVKTMEFMRSHPHRIWCSPTVWFAQYPFSGSFENEYSQNASKVVEMIELNELKEEMEEKQYSESVSV